jgi:hypothetical protein
MLSNTITAPAVSFLCATVAAAALAEITTVDPVSIGLDTNKLTALRAALAKEVASDCIPGAVMLIPRQGKVGIFASGRVSDTKKMRLINV